jgi:hypothetical protein
MNKFLISILFLLNFVIYAQKKDVVYRIAYDSYPAVGYSYEVGVLYLRDDNSYRRLLQKYNSRKMARKNVLRSSVDEYGKWKMSGDTLFLYDNNNSPMKFFKISDKRITFIFDGIDRSRYYWRKVKN